MGVDQDNEAYRSFARGGIAAVIAINSLALGAVLSQITELRGVSEPVLLYSAFLVWIIGVVAGVSAWLFAAMAAQSYSTRKRGRELVFAGLGISAVLLSLGCFAFGAWKLAEAVILSVPG